MSDTVDCPLLSSLATDNGGRSTLWRLLSQTLTNTQQTMHVTTNEIASIAINIYTIRWGTVFKKDRPAVVGNDEGKSANEVCDCGDGEDDCSEGDGVFTAMGEEGSVLAGDELVGAILVGRITCIGLELLLMLREFVDVVKVM